MAFRGGLWEEVHFVQLTVHSYCSQICKNSKDLERLAYSVDEQ